MHDPDRHHRHSLRLPGYDYALVGAYYVTICTHERARLLGEVVDGAMRLSPSGEAAAAAWLWLATHHPWVTLGPAVVMPNHLHGIVIIGAAHENTAAT